MHISYFLKFQNYIIKNVIDHTFRIHSYNSLSKNDLNLFNLVIMHPNKDCENYYKQLGFNIFTDEKISKNCLIFSVDELLVWLLDDNKNILDIDVPMIRVLYTV